MLIQEKLAVAAILIAACGFLVKQGIAAFRKRNNKACGGSCGCGKGTLPVGKNALPR